MTKKELKLLIRECISEMRLNESGAHRFNFNAGKENILDHLRVKIRKPKESVIPQLKTHIYGIITGNARPEFLKIGFRDDQVDAYKKIIQNNLEITDGGDWHQHNINSKMPRKSGKDVTYNYYVTIEKTKENIIRFGNAINKIEDLNEKLTKISDKYQSPIAYKTHKYLQKLFEHNDSFKVFYYDKAMRHDIEKAVNDWFKDNNINTGNRLYKHGIDAKVDDEKQSYGTIIAGKIAAIFNGVIEKHGSKYTAEQYYDWFTQNFENLILKVKEPDSD
jgi:hypothetical protein